MLIIQDLSLQLGGKTLLSHAGTHISPGSKVGLIGRNGSGKSTLMRVLQGSLQADEGNIDYPNDWQVAYLDQSLPESHTSVVDYVCSGDKLWQNTMDKLAVAEQEEDGHAVAECHDVLATIDGYSTPSRAESILMGLGFQAHECKQPLSSFSGGWQMRSQLARVMMARADLLLLDEPTNHLDLEAILYLEQWLKRCPSTIILISHDREVLDNVSTHTIHLHQQKLRHYVGGVTAFMKQFQEAYEQEQKFVKKIEEKRAHMQSFVDRFRAKASKAKQAQSRLKALEKMQYNTELALDSQCQFSFLSSKSVGWPAISIQGDAGYPEKTILTNIRWSAGAQDRIGIIGKNGAGKTTFLKTLVQALPLKEGLIECHPDLKMGYFSQQQVDELDLNDTPLQALMRTDEAMTEQEARRHLAQFYFTQDQVKHSIAPFSGGEKARLALCILIWQRPNFLLLDEPTNHLDMPMREALIEALQGFCGAVILVSHDRHLLNCTVNQYYLVGDGAVRSYDGSLMDYAIMTLKKPEPSKKANTTPKKKSNAVHIENELKKIEKRLTHLSEKQKKLDEQLADNSLYDGSHEDKVQSLTQRRESLSQEVKDLESQWEELAADI